MLTLRHILLLCFLLSINNHVTECQILTNLKSWWSSYGDTADTSNNYQSYTTAVQIQDNKVVDKRKVIAGNHEKTSVVRYGEWTSAPRPATTPRTFKRPIKVTTVPPTIISRTTIRTTTTTRRTTTASTTRGISSTRTTTQRSSTREFEFSDSGLLDHTIIYITTPAPLARRAGLAVVVGDWTRATSLAPVTKRSSESLFDSMVEASSSVTRLPLLMTRAPSLQNVTTTTSLFESTEIFYENFTKQDNGSVILSQNPLLDAINRNITQLRSKLPPIPSTFIDVINNHTNRLKSLFDETPSSTHESLIQMTTVPSTGTSSSGSLFSLSLQNDPKENTFSVSRPAGNIEETLIISGDGSSFHHQGTDDRQTRIDLSLENNSRFGMSRPKVRGFVFDESERSSPSDQSSGKKVKLFKNHKYSFSSLVPVAEKDLTIEQILEASQTTKDLDLSPRHKPRYPVYINKNMDNSISGRSARQQDRKFESLDDVNLPFDTGRIFDSGTGQLEDLDPDTTRTLFLQLEAESKSANYQSEEDDDEDEEILNESSDDEEDDDHDYYHDDEDNEDNVSDYSEESINDSPDEEDKERNETSDYEGSGNDLVSPESDQVFEGRSLSTGEFLFDERSRQGDEEAVRRSLLFRGYPGALHYRLVPHYPHHYYRPLHYPLIPRPYAYFNPGQLVYTPLQF